MLYNGKIQNFINDPQAYDSFRKTNCESEK